MLSKEEVKKIAKLARIDLADKEVEKFQKELSEILGYVEQLKEVDISGADLVGCSNQLKNIMREDEADEKPAKQREKLLESMPETPKESLGDPTGQAKDSYLKVKSILDEIN